MCLPTRPASTFVQPKKRVMISPGDRSPSKAKLFMQSHHGGPIETKACVIKVVEHQVLSKLQKKEPPQLKDAMAWCQ
jgi:hypothetical protein